MKENNSRREFLSQSGKMVTAAALFGTSVPLAHAGVAGTLNCEANNTMKITDPHYYLDNVLLETGFDYENGVAVQTRTARQTVEIQDGKIVALRENKQHPDATLPHYDAGGKLMLPSHPRYAYSSRQNLLRRAVALAQSSGRHHLSRT